ncbi:Tn3 family transposase [Streptomyces anulatus]
MERLVANYRTLLQQVDVGGPAQSARAKAAALTKQVLDALEGLDEESSAAEAVAKLEGRVSPALLTLAEGLMVQANGLASLTAAVEGLGGFDAQYAQIERVSAHHGDNWEVLLHGHLKADRPVMFDLTDVIELKATSEDSSVLDALAHAKAHRAMVRDFIPDRDTDGRRVDVSFATQNWQKAIRDRRRPGHFVRRHFEAMMFYYLADELRTGDVAAIGSEEYADWSEQLLPWEQVEAKLPEYLAEVGLAASGEQVPFDGRALVAQLRGRLSAAAAAADGEYPDNYELFIDPDSGVPKLKARRAEKPRRSALVLEQAIKERMPERTLLGIVARTAYWIEWWNRFGPASGNDPKLKDPFGRYVITTFVKGTNMTFAEAARHITGVSGHELSVAALRHVTTAKLNEAIGDVVDRHAQLDLSWAWGNGTTAAADGTNMDTYLDNLLAETSVGWCRARRRRRRT